jgi:hypothetical protein
MKQEYIAPTLTVLGTIADITRPTKDIGYEDVNMSSFWS